MNPSLEAVLFSAPTISFHVNRVSAELPMERRIFKTDSLNDTIVFKYPNFDITEQNLVAIPGLEDLTGGKQINAVRTALYVPKDKHDLKLGGYGLYTDQPDFKELMLRHCGMDFEKADAEHDIAILRVLAATPSLDPFIVNESFLQAGIQIDPTYVTIAAADTARIRHIIGEKVKPIVSKAMAITNPVEVVSKTRRFIDSIWDPSLNEALLFIQAFGIAREEAPTVFGAWKGIAFFQNEYIQSRQRIGRVTEWLKSENSKPREWRQLTRDEKQQIEMFRKSIFSKIQTIQQNITDIFDLYEESYKKFLAEDNPKHFRDFLFRANQYYWTLGACNGVLEQISMTWRRYYRATEGRGQLNFDQLERMFKVCDAVLRSRANDKGGAI